MSKIVSGRSMRRGKYNWDRWFDGRQHELIPGDDYQIETRHMQSLINATAIRRGLTVVTRQTADGTLLVEQTGSRAA